MSRRTRQSAAAKNQLSLFAEAPAPEALAAEEARPLPDAAARALASGALDRSLLVEAGAGTGKTTLIVERIAALVESGVPIGKIVAITFTEKAAGELKLRVRHELEKRSTPHARRALADLEQASISTIHAWCSRLLREYPVEAGVDPLYRVLDEPGREALFTRVWESWVGRALSGDEPVPLEELPGRTPDWWLRNLSALGRFLVQQRHRLPAALPVAHGADPLPELERALARVPELRRAADEWCRKPDDRMALAIRDIESAAEAFLAATPARRRIQVLGPTPLKDSYEKVGAKTNWKAPVDDPLGTVRALAATIAGAWHGARAALEHEIAAGVARWLSESFLPAYEAEKRRQGALDFDDLLVLARDLLRRHPAVRRRVRRGIRQLILDEFQDTDPVQCEAAFLLTAADEREDWKKATPAPGALFLVGDPKQSIYAFRGADIRTYLAARERLAADGSVVEISTNFRSRRGVLEWVNAAFDSLIRESGHIQPPYRPLDAWHEGDAAGSGVHVLRAPADAAWETVEESREAEARAVAALLRDRVLGNWVVRDRRSGTERAAAWGDMVVLLRNRVSSLPAFERAFRAADVPYVVVGGRALWERLEVRALAALCAAVENPFDGVSVVAALKSPFFGASDAELLLWKHRHGGFFANREDEDGVVGRALAMIRGWHRERLEIPPERLLQRMLAETGAVASFGLKPDGAQRVANLLRLVDASRGAGDAFGIEGAPPSFRAWVRWLEERVRSLREEAEGAVLEEEGDAVRVLTMHAAKGLEFPIVVLGDLAAREPPAEPFHADPRTGRLAFRLGSKEVGLTTEGFDDAKTAHEERTKAEDLRLLYVAATRARDALVLPLFASRRGRGGFYGALTAAFQDLLDPAKPSLPAGEGGPAHAVDDELVPIAGVPPVFRVPASDLEAALDATPEASGARAADGGDTDPDPDARAHEARIVARRHPRAVAPVTRLVHPDDGSPGRRSQEAHTWTAAEAAALGTSVHRALEIMDLDDADGAARAASAEARAAGLSSALAERASALARAALALPALDRARRSPRRLREWPFALRGDGASPWIVEGVVDLAWVEDGGLVVLDYKTDAVTTGAEIDAAAAHHRPQLLAYAWALGRVTNLPVHEIVLAFLAPAREILHRVTPADLTAAQRAIESGFTSLAAPH